MFAVYTNSGIIEPRLDLGLQGSWIDQALHSSQSSCSDLHTYLALQERCFCALGEGMAEAYCLSTSDSGQTPEARPLLRADEVMHCGLAIARGLAYMHVEHKLLHGDIKSANVLVSRDLKTVKICDLGVSLRLQDDLSGLLHPGMTPPFLCDASLFRTYVRFGCEQNPMCTRGLSHGAHQKLSAPLAKAWSVAHLPRAFKPACACAIGLTYSHSVSFFGKCSWATCRMHPKSREVVPLTASRSEHALRYRYYHPSISCLNKSSATAPCGCLPRDHPLRSSCISCRPTAPRTAINSVCAV